MKKNREQPESELRQNTQANEVLVWGSNLKGQLGVGENLQGLNFTKVKFPFLISKPKLCLFQISLKSVSCGYEHTILLTSNTKKIILKNFPKKFSYSTRFKSCLHNGEQFKRTVRNKN